jgi:alpha-tubulin suppressor-like RCC1 family protein
MGLGVADGPGAMLPEGKILFCAGPATTYGGPANFFEFDPVGETMTAVDGPTGVTFNASPYVISMLDLPDGTVLMSVAGSQLYVYQPDGAPLAAGKPVITGISTNADGSLQLAGTLLNGISEGAAYGDDEQMSSNYPILRFADGSGNVLWARVIRRIFTGVQSGTNQLAVDFEPPGGLTGGTWSVTVIANGISSDPFALATSATPPPSVRGVTPNGITSSHFQLKWNPVRGSESGYRIDRSPDGATFSTYASAARSTNAFSDNHVAPLTRYYYRVVATNAEFSGEPGGSAFGATPPAAALPGAWAAQDIGFVPGPGASGVSGGTVTVLGSGRPLADPRDQLQFAYQKTTGDLSITAQIGVIDTAASNTTTGVMIRSTLDAAAPFVAVTTGPAGGVSFVSRRLKERVVDQLWTGPYADAIQWLRLVRTGDVFAAFASPDGSHWTLLGEVATLMPRAAFTGLMATSGDENLLGRAVFNNVAIVSSPPKFGITPSGPSQLTNECHTAFVDPGAEAIALAARVACGADFAAVVRRDGLPAAWGETNASQAAFPASAVNLTSIAAGAQFAVGVRSDGRLTAWGDNTYGQTTTPTTANFQSTAAGLYHALGLKADGTVQQWGDTNRGQSIPPTNMDTILSISAGADHSMAMSTAGKIYTWGANNSGQNNVPSVAGPVGIAAGGYHSLAVTAAGTVTGWGANSYKQATAPAGLKDAVAVAAGLYHSLALRANGTVVGWGSNTRGQAVPPGGLSNVIAIAAGSYFSAALRADGTVVTWGDNSAGQQNQGSALIESGRPVGIADGVDTNTPGTYVINYSVSDGAGGTASLARTVVVADTTPPALSVRGANPFSVMIVAAFVDPGAEAFDTCAGDLSSAIVTTGSVDTANPGEYTVNYTATDPAGNFGAASRTVLVVSAPPPPVVAAEWTSQGILLKFPAVQGATYDVLWASNPTLPAGEWTPAGTATATPDGFATFADVPVTGVGERFYRVRTR